MSHIIPLDVPGAVAKGSDWPTCCCCGTDDMPDDKAIRETYQNACNAVHTEAIRVVGTVEAALKRGGKR